jgi:hypothetical protein
LEADGRERAHGKEDKLKLTYHSHPAVMDNGHCMKQLTLEAEDGQSLGDVWFAALSRRMGVVGSGAVAVVAVCLGWAITLP